MNSWCQCALRCQTFIAWLRLSNKREQRIREANIIYGYRAHTPLWSLWDDQNTLKFPRQYSRHEYYIHNHPPTTLQNSCHTV